MVRYIIINGEADTIARRQGRQGQQLDLFHSSLFHSSLFHSSLFHSSLFHSRPLPK
ncbi:hypothetical protein ACRALDRAFT_1093112 [Sodiomyces alcalophilus JCM 7366]|uniref:uncharacterized protein n=1 Tax=Sodiomyces alcalophilus JCM 7366 TaxID=591952 RepID=UPI0039B6268E